MKLSQILRYEAVRVLLIPFPSFTETKACKKRQVSYVEFPQSCSPKANVSWSLSRQTRHVRCGWQHGVTQGTAKNKRRRIIGRHRTIQDEARTKL